MAEEKNVLFRVTRERTTIFHPDRSVSLAPVQTGEEIELPESVAKYHVKNGVGVVVDKAAQEPEAPQGPEAPQAPVKRGPGRPAAK